VARILVTGAGLGGLITAMLLADDGHDVTVLERDDMLPPTGPAEAWKSWERTGVNQFHQLHFFQSRFRAIVESELPLVAKGLDDAGALRFNAIALAPPEFTGGQRDGDGDFEALTGRRPVVEAALAAAAEAVPGLTVRRGVGVRGLVAGPPTRGVPNVTGVVAETGEAFQADLVVDATGRRSPLPAWLEGIGASRPVEELEDSGFVYYGRHFRAADGSQPALLGPLLQDYGSLSILMLPADNGTWGVGIITSAKDKALRGLRHVDRWMKTVRSFPLVAHWVEGEPLDPDVAVMAKIEDRHRQFVVDGRPVATGVVAVGDSWACTNPSLGRGATMGAIHALALRDLVRDAGLDDPLALAAGWDAATAATVEPWYAATLRYDRHRLAEIEANIGGEPYDPGDPEWEMTKALMFAAGQDADCLRGFLSIASLVRTPDEVFGDSVVAEKVFTVGAAWRDATLLGPGRAELAALASG
jgi:2-polyprenyl-6-methoxyphenol hydroxylase-like FAD-dependent oxidoreductase